MGWKSYLKAKGREFISLFGGAYRGAVHHSQTFLATTHDSSQGEMYLENDRLRIKWPDVGKQEVFQFAKGNFQRLAGALNGTFLPNPIWTRLFGYRLVTVHPLGGCRMGNDHITAVSNHKGLVFTGHGNEVHTGLYVCDASIIPTTLGTNPILTISTIAERNIALLIKDYGWTLTYNLPSRPSKKLQTTTGFQFTETMRGYFSTAEKTDYAIGAQRGKTDKSPFEFTLTVLAEDIEKMLNDSDHQAQLFGTVNAPVLSPKPLMVSKGIFNLLIESPDDPKIRLMRYRMTLSAQDGKSYYFEGFKRVRRLSPLHIWGDTTTLYITVYEGENENAPLLGKGIIKIRIMDFFRQLRTLAVPHAKSTFNTLKYILKFGTFFTRRLF